MFVLCPKQLASSTSLIYNLKNICLVVVVRRVVDVAPTAKQAVAAAMVVAAQVVATK
jgi:hypothetical protein